VFGWPQCIGALAKYDAVMMPLSAKSAFVRARLSTQWTICNDVLELRASGIVLKGICADSNRIILNRYTLERVHIG
jgi:hypothetical protein